MATGLRMRMEVGMEMGMEAGMGMEASQATALGLSAATDQICVHSDSAGNKSTTFSTG